MSKNDKPSNLDYTNAITNSHNEESKALNVVTVNNFVPARYGKVEIDYITSGNGVGNVGTVRYYSNGIYNETRVTCCADLIGSAHKTTISFMNRTAQSLAGKSFIIYDNDGPVKVWFNVDFNDAEPPNSNTIRSIEINLLSSHTSDTIANRTAQAINLDSSFLTGSNSFYLVISSSSTGIKSNSYDVNSDLFLKNTPGTPIRSLNNKSFFINSASNLTEYYVWYNVAGQGIDPNIANKTGIMVAIPRGSDASLVAENTKQVLDSIDDFITNISEDTLLVINKLIGITELANENDSGFTIFNKKMGADRELLATLVMTYSESGDILSVERL